MHARCVQLSKTVSRRVRPNYVGSVYDFFGVAQSVASSALLLLPDD